ncbi:MAG: tetratricopeptide repeat protein [Myxococcota bacterium]
MLNRTNSLWMGLLALSLSLLPEQAHAMKLSAETPSPRLGLKTSFVPAQDTPVIRVALDAEVPVTEQANTEELEAASLYRQGLYLSSQGRFQEAQSRFESLLQKYPTSSLAASAQQQLEQVKTVLSVPPTTEGMAGTPAAGTPVTSAPAKHSSGKAELLVSQSLLGGYALSVLPIAADLSLGSTYALFPLLGLGAGLGAGQLYSTQVPVSSAQAQFIWQTQTFSAYNAVLWKIAFDSASSDYVGNPLGASLVGLGLGTALGYGFSPQLPLTEGQVTAGFSAGAWAPGLMMALLTATSEFADPAPAALFLLPISSELAAVGAFSWMLKENIQLSRGRARLINLGGLLGLASAGALIAVSETDSALAVGSLLFAGMGGGLALGVVATNGWDQNTSVSGLPISSMPSVVAFQDGQFKLGSPLPQLAQAVRERGKGEDRIKEHGTQVQVGLLSGQF